MHRFLTFLAVTLTCLLISTSAFADLLDDLYKKGSKAYLAGDFTEAILNFEQAARLDKDSVIRLNLSLCYAALGNHREALKYAMAARNGNLKKEVEMRNSHRIPALGRIVHAEDTANAIAMKISAGKASNSNVGVVRNETKVQIDTSSQAANQCRSDSDCSRDAYCGRNGMCQTKNIEIEDRRFSAVGWGGTIVAGMGIGLLVYSNLVSSAASIDKTELDKLINRRQYADKKLVYDEGLERSIHDVEEDFEVSETRSQDAFLGGVGLLAIGAGLIIYDLVTVERMAVSWSPILSFDGVGVLADYRF